MHSKDSLEEAMAEVRRMEKDGALGGLVYIWALA